MRMLPSRRRWTAGLLLAGVCSAACSTDRLTAPPATGVVLAKGAAGGGGGGGGGTVPAPPTAPDVSGVWTALRPAAPGGVDVQWTLTLTQRAGAVAGSLFMIVPGAPEGSTFAGAGTIAADGTLVMRLAGRSKQDATLRGLLSADRTTLAVSFQGTQAGAPVMTATTRR